MDQDWEDYADGPPPLHRLPTGREWVVILVGSFVVASLWVPGVWALDHLFRLFRS